MAGNIEYLFEEEDSDLQIDMHVTGNTSKKIVVVMLNGIGQLACRWPPTLVSRLEAVAEVVRVDLKGHLNVQAHPSIDSLLDDISDIRRRCGNKRVFLLGFSFGGIATQLVMSHPPLAKKFAGFVLIATACEFLRETYERTYAGVPPAPVMDLNLTKSVFCRRAVPAGVVSQFVDGPPEAWTVVQKPNGGPQNYPWAEHSMKFLMRKVDWLFPRNMRAFVLKNHNLWSVFDCPSSPEHYTFAYLDFATSLVKDEKTGQPGQGILYNRLHALKKDPEDRTKVLIAFGSQDAIFPIEAFESVVETAARIYPRTTAVLYCDPEEQRQPVPGERANLFADVERHFFGAGGHALLFQDDIVTHFADRLVRWLITP